MIILCTAFLCHDDRMKRWQNLPTFHFIITAHKIGIKFKRIVTVVPKKPEPYSLPCGRFCLIMQLLVTVRETKNLMGKGAYLRKKHGIDIIRKG